MVVLLALLAGGGFAVAKPAEGAAQTPAAHGSPSLVLLTLDTTRADHLGSYGARGFATPVLDSLAATGVRYRRALTPSPLTLPAHASLMTGLEPPEHGVRDNGISALSGEIPTLATALSESGFDTAAFVASRVLDRRFGLDRGFDVYDDQMTAERLGEYGYPERDAAAVTSAAIFWLGSVPTSRPFFLWVHYYDPHAPYDAPGALRSATLEQRYAGEVAFMDREIGRLLAALPAQTRGRVVAVVGDHGESLGEHGERSHGIFLYGASLNVPLVIAGRGVPEGRVVEDVVSIRRLPATLLRLLELSLGLAPDSALHSKLPGPPLPGIFGAEAETVQGAVYSETRLPATAYGWAPLRAVSDNRWRLIEAPRSELYDLVADPGETRDLAAENPGEARRLLRYLRRFEGTMEPRQAPPAERDSDLDAALRDLGYLDSGLESGAEEGAIDPKDGIRWLDEFEHAKVLAARGDHREALVLLQELVRRNPENVPFLTHLAGAQLANGDTETGIATYRRAIGLNPKLEFLHLNLADAYRRLGRTEEARREYEVVVQLNPRSGAAWLKLAAAAHDAGRAEEEKRLLNRAVEMGTTSGVVHYRLGQMASEGDDFEKAERHFRLAIELIPGWMSPWLGRGDAAVRNSRFDEALACFRRAAQIEPRSPGPLLGLARVYRAKGESVEARRLLEQLLATAPLSSEAGEARGLLAEIEDLN